MTCNVGQIENGAVSESGHVSPVSCQNKISGAKNLNSILRLALIFWVRANWDKGCGRDPTSSNKVMATSSVSCFWEWIHECRLLNLSFPLLINLASTPPQVEAIFSPTFWHTLGDLVLLKDLHAETFASENFGSKFGTFVTYLFTAILNSCWRYIQCLQNSNAIRLSTTQQFLIK